MRACLTSLLLAGAWLLGWRSSGAASVGPTVQYTLLKGSTLTDHCPVCGRPDILVPMQGTFQLELLDENPLLATYALRDVSFVADSPAGWHYALKGKGVFRYGGEVALVQDLFLELQVDDGVTNRVCYFTNDAANVTQPWPMFEINADQTNGTLIQQFLLQISALPFREIWFSTRHGFHAGIWNPPTNFVSAGDLVSTAGRVVKRNQELTARLGLMPVVPDLGLDAVDVLPAGEIAFSVETSMFSESLGVLLNAGDLLSNQGRVIAGYASQLKAFGAMPPVSDPGLDGVQVLDNGEIYFSVGTNFFSEALGQVIQHGDLLSNRGRVIKTNGELLARFSPADPKQDYGLDAFHVWPNGEVWFSVATGFSTPGGASYLPGDLLSDQGFVVYRNLDLLSPFQPLEDLYDFGLDALFVISDATSPGTPAPATHCTRVGVQPGSGDVRFEWETPGRAWQMEKATDLLGPWLPLGPILTEPPAGDPGAASNGVQGYYRLRQWF
jgi:hypothetical protein